MVNDTAPIGDEKPDADACNVICFLETDRHLCCNRHCELLILLLCECQWWVTVGIVMKVGLGLIRGSYRSPEFSPPVSFDFPFIHIQKELHNSIFTCFQSMEFSSFNIDEHINSPLRPIT